jgi:hypothetical protein
MSDVRPRGIPDDTSVDAWKVEMQALRRLTPAERHALWFEFQCELDEMAMNAIRRARPDADERRQLAEFVRRAHGADVARAAYPDLDLDEP